jgi:hypothetical protein
VDTRPTLETTSSTSSSTTSTSTTISSSISPLNTFMTTTTTTFGSQIFGNTLSCFYAKFYGISGGILIASIEISGTVDSSLFQCCEKCMLNFIFKLLTAKA